MLVKVTIHDEPGPPMGALFELAETSEYKHRRKIMAHYSEDRTQGTENRLEKVDL